MTMKALIFPLLLVGCAIHAQREGLVSVDGSRVTLMDVDGRLLTLSATGEAAAVRYLDGCIVEVTGTRFGERMAVRGWEVRDAGDGSAPFVGVLEHFGSNWVVKDRTTGQPILLEEASVGALAGAAGRLVLVRGYVVGVQTIRVVDWRLLSGGPTP